MMYVGLNLNVSLNIIWYAKTEGTLILYCFSTFHYIVISRSYYYEEEQISR